jgi:hypothetical protein
MLAEEHGTPVDVRWCLDQMGNLNRLIVYTFLDAMIRGDC